MRNAIRLLFFSLSLLYFAATASADDYKWPDPCDDLAEVPGIKDLRQAKSTFDDKVSKLRETTTALKADCDFYKSNPQQAGTKMDQLKQHQAAAGQQSSDVTGAGTDYKGKIKTTSDALKSLGGGTECSNNLRAQDAGVDSVQNKLKSDITQACGNLNTSLDSNLNGDGTKDEKAQRAGALANGLDANKDPKAVAAALSDPKGSPANRAMSQQLLNDADAYAKAHPPMPSPKVSSSDTVCGEACVSILRAQAAEKQYGTDSWQYQSYITKAQNTKPGKFGTVTGPFWTTGG